MVWRSFAASGPWQLALCLTSLPSGEGIINKWQVKEEAEETTSHVAVTSTARAQGIEYSKLTEKHINAKPISVKMCHG